MFKNFTFFMISLVLAVQAHATSNVGGRIEVGKPYPAVISVGSAVLLFGPPRSNDPQLVIKSMDIPGFSECVFFLSPVALFPSERVTSSYIQYSCKKIDALTGLSSTTHGDSFENPAAVQIVSEDGLSGISAGLVVRQGGVFSMKDAIPSLVVNAGQKVYLYFKGEDVLSGPIPMSMPAPPGELFLKNKTSKVSK